MIKINNNPTAIAAIFLLAAIMIIVLGAVPIIMDIQKVAVLTGQCRSEIGIYDRRIGNAHDFINFAKQETSGLDMINGVFADAKMPLGLINSLEDAAQMSGVEIELSPMVEQKLPQGEDWPFLKTKVNASGSVEAILGFIDKIENSPYLIEIETVSIQTDKIDEGPHSMSVHGRGEQQEEDNSEKEILSAAETSVAAQALISLKVYAQLQSE